MIYRNAECLGRDGLGLRVVYDCYGRTLYSRKVKVASVYIALRTL
jgi:hypothetical protein